MEGTRISLLAVRVNYASFDPKLEEILTAYVRFDRLFHNATELKSIHTLFCTYIHNTEHLKSIATPANHRVPTISKLPIDMGCALVR